MHNLSSTIQIGDLLSGNQKTELTRSPGRVFNKKLSAIVKLLTERQLINAIFILFVIFGALSYL